MSAWEGSGHQEAWEQELKRKREEQERLAKMTPEQRAKYRGVPMIQRLPITVTPVETNPIVAVCGECGRDVFKVESYTCDKPRCPIVRTP